MSEAVKVRPPVSGSMALKCRMFTWLQGHEYQPEPVQPGTQRTFDLGTIIEAAMLRGVSVILGGDPIEQVTLGPWWKDLGEVKDYATGKSFVAELGQLSDFQRAVEFAGVVGHVDAIVTLDTGRYVLDTKSTQGYGYDRSLKNNLHEDVFAKSYIGQLHHYMAGLMAEGEEIAGAVLVYFNKENSQVMARFVDYDPAIVEELKERLSWAKSDGEPEPDWEWTRGVKVPLACQYCNQRQNCAQVRGLNLNLEFVKGKPSWIVT